MSDIPPGGATVQEAAVDPAAQAVASNPDTIFEQAGARDVPIEVDMDDGTVETMTAGEIQDAIDQRRNDANALLECLRYGR